MKTRDYTYLKDTHVEITRSDEDFNIGQYALVKDVDGDSLYVEVDNGEIFWTDVDSVSHEPDTRKHLVYTDKLFFEELKGIEWQLQNLIANFQNDSKMSPWQIDGWNSSARNFKSKFEKLIKEANKIMWENYNKEEVNNG
jgi:hypothetical protein